MTPTTNATSNNGAIASAYQNGQNLQNMYNTQSTAAQGQENSASGAANTAQSNLQNFTGSMLNGNQLYGQDLTNANSMYGVNPVTIQNFQKAAAQNAAQLANLPQAIQQQGNGYGTLAGSEANNYANMSPQIVAAGAYDNSQLQNQQAFVSAAQNAANQQSTQALTGQQQQLSGYQSSASNATAIQQNAIQQMNNVETLAQNQGYATAQQVAAYQNAYNNYVTAQANQTTAGATAGLDAAQVAQLNQQVQLAAQAAAKSKSSNTLSVQPSNGISLGSSPSNSNSILQAAGVNIQ